jgi:outer membrane protein assembly factor BamB
VETAWSADIGDQIRAGASIGNEMVITSSSKNAVVAYSLSDGSEIWKFEADNTVKSFPTISGDLVYFGTGELYSNKGALFAISIGEGNEKWRFDQGTYGIIPTITDDLAIFATGEKGVIYAFKKESGELNWKFSPDFKDKDNWVTAAAVKNDTAYAITSGGALFALDIGDGSKKWSTDTGLYAAKLISVGDLIFLCSLYGEELLAFNKNDGSKEWSFSPDSWGQTSTPMPAIAGNNIVFSTQDKVYNVNAGTGEVKWRAKLPSSDNYSITSPIIANDVVYDSNGADLRAIKLSNGEKLWRHSIKPISALSVIDGHIVVCSMEKLHILEEN